MPSINAETEELVLTHTAVSAPYASAHAATLQRAALLLLISLFAIVINGYHPFCEDAGIYVSAIKQALVPELYGSSAVFIAPYLHSSVFPHLAACLIVALRIPVSYLLFVVQIGTTWLLLGAIWKLAGHCFDRTEERWASVLLVAVCLSTPVAGTSLFMMDPYLTGRSFSTPLALLAVCACLEARFLSVACLLICVALVHPLMSIYALGFVLVLAAIRRKSWVGVAALATIAIAAGAIVQYSQRAATESSAYQAAILSRYYTFLSEWHWYEWIGIIAPLVLLAAYSFWRRNTPQATGVLLARTCLVLGVTSIVVSSLFAHPDSHSHLIAALQTLRTFLLIYFCMFLLLGGLLCRFVLRTHPALWALCFLAIAGGLAFAQHETYSASPHLELPWTLSSNPWNQAFLWIRAKTPANAFFALDSDYIHSPGEDSQGFRAIAERASLADSSKDGGAAAVFPSLAPRWMLEQTATIGLNHTSDADRLHSLAPFHVNWIVLDSSAATAFHCPFTNSAVKVCQLP